jgi:branched-chain amino acid transport system permease protein
MAAAADATASLPILPRLLDPDRWPLWLGLLFILLVLFFPAGIAGTLMKKGSR